ncbi:MAG: hypothetical protein MJ196_00455 [Treponemataceae bacterium]|nr:hypothetical protein [Treponemataceae bacterium]
MKDLKQTEISLKNTQSGTNRKGLQDTAAQGEALKKVCTGVLGINPDRVSVVHLQNQTQLEAFARQWKDSNK